MFAVAQTFDGKRTIPSPEVTQLMLALLELDASDVLMEIGTGSAYQTEQFAKTGAEIHTIELEPWIDTTKEIGDYVFLHSGDGAKGLPNHAPFTAIVATCGIEQIPQAWTEQLSDGGRLVVPIGDAGCQRLTKFRKHGSELIPERIAAYTRFQMLRSKPVPGKVKYCEQTP